MDRGGGRDDESCQEHVRLNKTVVPGGFGSVPDSDDGRAFRGDQVEPRFYVAKSKDAKG